MLKIENDATWEGMDDLIAFRRSIKAEISSVYNSDNNDASNKENMMDAHCSDDQHDSPASTTKLIQNKNEARTDRTVTRIKLPEVIVCFNDGAHRIVKDVCIEDSLQSLQEILLETNGASEHMKASKIISIPDLTQRKDVIAPILEDNSGSFIEGGEDRNSYWDSTVPLILEDLNLSSFNEDSKDTNSCDMSESGEGAITSNQVSTDTFDQKISLEQLLALEEPQSPRHVNSSISNLDAVNKESNDEKNAEETNIDEVSIKKSASLSVIIESNQGSQPKDSFKDDESESTFLEGFPGTSDVLSDAKAFNHNSENKEVCSHGKGETINHELDLGAVVSDMKENEEDTDGQHLVQAHSVTEESISDGATAFGRSSFYQSSHADKNLLGPSYLSDPKASSGHIAYSGSISLRSDSSTTSTRSFAFPILQSEWNTSPVKMAKADRRYLRKQRCLRTVLFCCKF